MQSLLRPVIDARNPLHAKKYSEGRSKLSIKTVRIAGVHEKEPLETIVIVEESHEKPARLSVCGDDRALLAFARLIHIRQQRRRSGQLWGGVLDDASQITL